MTLADRLLAGEHHGCSTWAEVARKLGVDERRMRIVRKALEARGTPVGLVPNKWVAEIQGVSSPFVDASPETVAAVARQWPSVEAFDRDECSNDGNSTCDRGGVPLDPIPECFTVREVATQLDPSGNLEKQWIGARRDSRVFEEIQPSVPTGHGLKGVSTLVDERGNVRAQWIKTSTVNDERAAWLDAIREISSALPRIEPSPAPEYSDEDLLAVYPVGDPHIGLLSWHEDAGENFDLEIAERRIVGAFQHLTALAPSAAEALLIFIGDNDHADGHSTTTKGTRVDVDGRFVKRARTSIRTGRRAVDLALAKHRTVRLIWERGNHDELISAMTALAFSLIYENEPRVTVDISPEVFHWYRFGANLIGTHHGDKVKPMDLLGVMAVDRQQDWGETTHRRFYCGHYHHQIVKEVPGLIIEYLPTLAGSDAWHRSMGYRSGRAMYLDVLHREHGHINRHIVGINQLRAA